MLLVTPSRGLSRSLSVSFGLSREAIPDLCLLNEVLYESYMISKRANGQLVELNIDETGINAIQTVFYIGYS